MGRRGQRALRDDGPRARRRLYRLGAIVAFFACVTIVWAPAAVLLATMAPVGLALLLGAFVRADAEKTAGGELLAAATLSAVGVPVAVASGATMVTALTMWGGWCIAFASATLAVRTVIASARGPIAIGRRIGLPLVLSTIGIVLTAAGLVPAWLLLAFGPTLALALALAARPPSPSRLRTIGWMLVAATTFAAIALAVGTQLGFSRGETRSVGCHSTTIAADPRCRTAQSV
jgi:hypothetical protein